MDTPFKEANGSMEVACYAVQVYLPGTYIDAAYRGNPMYSMIGDKIKCLFVGNMRFFNNETEFENPLSVPCYPLGEPLLVVTEPSDIEVRDVQFVKNGIVRNCIVLTYYKGSKFLVSVEAIQSLDSVMMVLTRLKQGKLDHIPPEVAISVLHDAERYNGVDLRMPSEEEEIFVAERYRDPTHKERMYRFHTGAPDPDNIVSYNMRTDAQQSTTFQGVMHEDIATSMITAVNRYDAGIRDEPAPFERVIRGLDLEEYKKADYADYNEE